ncbi:MAG: hypothetical protein EON59_06055 [Alphaproteobacteria bacterium]|nr:MAG: hypothetical protein EON59_06055 [Alphaproteobacteria bacterium]
MRLYRPAEEIYWCEPARGCCVCHQIALVNISCLYRQRHSWLRLRPHRARHPRTDQGRLLHSSCRLTSPGGRGFGPAICKQLVTLMDGDICVDSREGEGSAFTDSIPLPRAEAIGADDRDPEETNLEGCVFSLKTTSDQSGRRLSDTRGLRDDSRNRRDRRDALVCLRSQTFWPGSDG